MKNGRSRMTATQCLEHPFLMEQDIGRAVLPKVGGGGGDGGGWMLRMFSLKVKLKQFQARRKWARCVEAIRAMTKLSDIMTKRRSLRSMSLKNMAVGARLETGVSLRRVASLSDQRRTASSLAAVMRLYNYCSE